MRNCFYDLCLYKNLDNDCKRLISFIWICEYLWSGEATLHGRDICWKLLTLASCLVVQLSGATHPRSSLKFLLLPAAGEAGFWLMGNSVHTCLAMASQPLNGSQKSLSYMLEFKWKVLHLNLRLYFSSSFPILNSLSEEDWALVRSFPFPIIYSRRRSMFQLGKLSVKFSVFDDAITH